MNLKESTIIPSRFKKNCVFFTFILLIIFSPAILSANDEASEEYIGNAETHYNLARAFIINGKYKKAIESFESAKEHYKKEIELNYHNSRAHLGLAYCYIALNEKSSALTEYKILKEFDKENADTLLDLLILIYK